MITNEQHDILLSEIKNDPSNIGYKEFVTSASQLAADGGNFIRLAWDDEGNSIITPLTEEEKPLAIMEVAAQLVTNALNARYDNATPILRTHITKSEIINVFDDVSIEALTSKVAQLDALTNDGQIEVGQPAIANLIEKIFADSPKTLDAIKIVMMNKAPTRIQELLGASAHAYLSDILPIIINALA